MSHKQYTQNLIIKNSHEVLKNSTTLGENRITGFSPLDLDQSTRPKYPEITIPGLINLHCHLAYSKVKLKSRELFPWIWELVKIHHMGEGLAPSDSIIGAKEAISYGTTFLVDNTNDVQSSINAFKKTGLKGLIGLEVFGSDPEQADNIFASTILKLASLEKIPNLDYTLSPHASYDVSALLWRLCLDWCKANQKPLLSHIAESEAEEAWFQDKDSELAQSAREFWSQINTLETKLANWQSHPSSTQYLQAHNLLKNPSLLTHLVCANKKDLELIKEAQIPIVTCPRSNIYLNNGLPNYQDWDQSNFGVGTDSKASNHDLDLRKEVNAIPGLTAQKRFELITNQAATILGRDDLGSLDIGKANDRVVLEIRNKDINFDSIDPFELIMDTELTYVKDVYIDGRLISL